MCMYPCVHVCECEHTCRQQGTASGAGFHTPQLGTVSPCHFSIVYQDSWLMRFLGISCLHLLPTP